MKKKALSLVVALMVFGVAVSVAQSRIILPDSSQITANPDSLDLLSRQVPHDHDHGHDHDHDHDEIDTVNLVLPDAKVWLLNARTGDKLMMPMDTLKYNFQQTTLPDGYSVATGFWRPWVRHTFRRFFSRYRRKALLFFMTRINRTINCPKINCFTVPVCLMRSSITNAEEVANKEKSVSRRF